MPCRRVHESGWKVSAVPVLLAILLLSGCGSLRLHSDVRDKQGTAAKEAWGKVDLSAMIAAERANLKKLLDAELDTQDRLAAAIRNHDLKAMVEAKTLQEGLGDRLTARLEMLAGKPNSSIDASTRIAASRKVSGGEADWQRRFDHTLETWTMLNVMPSSITCVDLGDSTQFGKIESAVEHANLLTRDLAESTLKKLRDLCQELKPNRYGMIAGEIARAVERRNSDSAALTNAKLAAKSLRLTYKDALAAYNSAANVADKSPAAVAKVGETLENLKKALNALDAAQDAFSIQFLAKERLDSLDKFVTAVTQSSTDGKLPQGADKATIAFVLLPQLVDDARKSLAEAKKPLAVPLLIRRNYEQLRLEAATREIAARETMVRLSKELVEILYEQAVQVWMAKNSFDVKNVAQALKPDMPMLDAFEVKNPEAREALYSASARYLDAVNRLDARRYKLEYMRIAAQHELQLAYSEVNAKQWEALIGATVDQVASVSAGGIKAESVAAMLNTIGILWIGQGVNK